MGSRPDVLVFALMTSLGACSHETTAPQGAAAVRAALVPFVRPEVWCPSSTDSALADSVPAQHRCHTTVNAPPPAPATRDSTWQLVHGSRQHTADSASRDSTRK